MSSTVSSAHRSFDGGGKSEAVGWLRASAFSTREQLRHSRRSRGSAIRRRRRTAEQQRDCRGRNTSRTRRRTAEGMIIAVGDQRRPRISGRSPSRHNGRAPARTVIESRITGETDARSVGPRPGTWAVTDGVEAPSSGEIYAAELRNGLENRKQVGRGRRSVNCPPQSFVTGGGTKHDVRLAPSERIGAVRR